MIKSILLLTDMGIKYRTIKITESTKLAKFKYIFSDSTKLVNIEIFDNTGTLNEKEYSKYLLIGAMDMQLTAILHAASIPYTV